MTAFIEKLNGDGLLSKNERFQKYIEDTLTGPPEDFPEARSVIILAVFTPLAKATFQYEGKELEIMVPPQYYRTGRKMEQLEYTVQHDIIGNPTSKIKFEYNVLLKHLAVRSGLAKYGRNNITYVRDMGSFFTLYVFLTDYSFEEDNWGDLEMLGECEKCRWCVRSCPTGAIREELFVLNAGKCISLYNEVSGEFPEWISSSYHNSLMGCMRCQIKCPANKQGLKKHIQLDTITEEETRAIVNEEYTESLMKSVSTKLRGHQPTTNEELYSVFSRNLRAVLEANSYD
ncbi:MAG: hypothetical protein GF411_10990 [Candidatus Lokiarchaeota archaeon]|nr:hypothetical protein [Candidatus Lokiarchaeota archaeon]